MHEYLKRISNNEFLLPNVVIFPLLSAFYLSGSVGTCNFMFYYKCICTYSLSIVCVGISKYPKNHQLCSNHIQSIAILEDTPK